MRDDDEYDAYGAWCSRVEQLLTREWKTKTREGRIYARAIEEHPHLTQLIDELEERRRAYVEQYFQDGAAELSARELLHKNPHRYYGVRQRDFY